MTREDWRLWDFGCVVAFLLVFSAWIVETDAIYGWLMGPVAWDIGGQFREAEDR